MDRIDLSDCAKELERVRMERNKAVSALQTIADACTHETAKRLALAVLEEIDQ